MKGATDTIRHLGTITAIEGNILHVKMLQNSACAGCHAAKLCQQKVMLLGSVRQGLKATVWAYMIPVVVLVVVMLSCTKCGLSEVACAMASLGAVAAYFFGLYLFRDGFTDRFSFRVE